MKSGREGAMGGREGGGRESGLRCSIKVGCICINIGRKCVREG